MIDDYVDKNNFNMYAARHYVNAQCVDVDEFNDDLKRFKYVKRLFNKYRETGDLKERLIINHIVVIYNVFGAGATRMLFFKLEGYHEYLKPFIVTLGYMPEHIDGIGNNDTILNSSDINMDEHIVSSLRVL